MSGGTLIAIVADKIYLDKNAILGRVDPQLSGLPAASITQVEQQKDRNEMKDRTLIFSDLSKKGLVSNETQHDPPANQ